MLAEAVWRVSFEPMDKRGFVREFLAYLRAHKRLWVSPIVVIGLLLLLLAALLFGPGAALETVYHI